MGETAKYATAFALRQAWDRWDEATRALMLWHTGLQESDVLSIRLQMLQLKDIPGYSTKNVDRAHLEAQLRDFVPEEA